MLDHVLHGYVNAMECEHGQISRRLHSLGQSLDTIGVHGQSKTEVQSVVMQLEELEHFLANHFKREEDGGFLDDAVSAAPRFGLDAKTLLGEHGTLLTRVKELTNVARSKGNCREEWPSIAAATRTLIRQLKAHEERENELLRRAFNVANGN